MFLFNLGIQLRFLTIAFLLLIVSQYGSASCGADRCNTTIDRVYPSGANDGVVYIKPAESLEGINCTPLGGIYFSLYKRHTVFDETDSLALTAVSNAEKCNNKIY